MGFFLSSSALPASCRFLNLLQCLTYPTVVQSAPRPPESPQAPQFPPYLPQCHSSSQPALEPPVLHSIPNLQHCPTKPPNLLKFSPAPKRNLIPYRATKSAGKSPNPLQNLHPTDKLHPLPSRAFQHFHTCFTFRLYNSPQISP